MTAVVNAPRAVTHDLLASVTGVHRAVVSCTEPGLVAGLGLVDQADAPVPVGDWSVLCHEGERLEAGAGLIEVTGSASDLGSAEDYVVGQLGFACGVATHARTIHDVAPAGLALACGGWKKLPAALKPALRAGLAVAGVRPRLLEEEFVYVPKNSVILLGGIAPAVRAGRDLAHGPVAVQVTDVAGALEAADEGAGAVMVDTGTLSVLEDVDRALRARGLREHMILGFGGGATAEWLVSARECGADVVDVGRAVLNAPLWDLRMEVRR